VLEPVLAPWLAGPIEHIGSTAVPGLVTKPEYAALKQALAVEHERDREAYTDAKEQFVRRVLAGL
jgi:GrpB-like predicted nucleotidyltransferase (UPF0157 family)